jgi:hypothetical protein
VRAARRRPGPARQLHAFAALTLSPVAFCRPQLLQAVYAICAAISAGNLRTMLVYVNNPLLSRALPLYGDVGDKCNVTVTEAAALVKNVRDARFAEAKAIQLLVADSIGGIIICGVYFIFSGVRCERSVSRVA